MRIRKLNIKPISKWSLFENNKDTDTIFNQLPISEEDVRDIFVEMEDLDYKIKISEIFLTKSGHTFKNNKGISEYYPIISISIDKYIPDEFGDETNWNGGVYYEEKQEVLDIMTNSIATLKSHLSGKARVLTAIRNMGDINIRIVLPFVVNPDEISLEELHDIAKKTINNYRGFNDNAYLSNLINLYHTEFTTSQGFKTFSFDISPILDRVPNVLPSGQIIIDSTSGSLIDKIIKSNQTDNKEQLYSVYNQIVKEILVDINKKYKDIKLKVNRHQNSSTYQFYTNNNTKDRILIEMDYWFDEFRSIDIPVGKKPIFGSRKKQKIDLYKMDIRINFKF